MEAIEIRMAKRQTHSEIKKEGPVQLEGKQDVQIYNIVICLKMYIIYIYNIII